MTGVIKLFEKKSYKKNPKQLLKITLSITGKNREI